jgi:acyl-CoA thioesterase YciA
MGNDVHGIPGRPEGAQGELMLRTFAFPADANPDGDIFGGWLLGQMDIAGASLARRRAHGRVATVAVAQMTFKLPVFVGDELSCYCTISKVGITSVTVQVEAWARRHDDSGTVKVTDGTFTYVAIGADRRARQLPPG